MSANDTQVGGNHYADEYQHWDFVADINLDYHRARALAYLERYRKKNGVEDLKKCLHFIRKCAEMEQKHWSHINRYLRRFHAGDEADAAESILTFDMEHAEACVSALLAQLERDSDTPVE